MSEKNTLRIVIEQSGTRSYRDSAGRSREKPNYSLSLTDESGSVVYSEPRCADNTVFCQRKGEKLIDYYQRNGAFPGDRAAANLPQGGDAT